MLCVTCLHFVPVGLFARIFVECLPSGMVAVAVAGFQVRQSIVVPTAAGVLEQIQNQIQIYGEHHVRTMANNDNNGWRFGWKSSSDGLAAPRRASDNGGVWAFTRR